MQATCFFKNIAMGRTTAIQLGLYLTPIFQDNPENTLQCRPVELIRILTDSRDLGSIECSDRQYKVILTGFILAAFFKEGLHLPWQLSGRRHCLCHVVGYWTDLLMQVVEGGLCCGSGIAVDELGDCGDEMCIAVAAVTVGYGVP